MRTNAEIRAAIHELELPTDPEHPHVTAAFNAIVDALRWVLEDASTFGPLIEDLRNVGDTIDKHTRN